VPLREIIRRHVVGYTLEAIIGPSAAIQPVAADLPAAALIALPQGIAMVPMTDEVFDAAGSAVTEARPLGFWKLPTGFEERLAAWSVAGPVGYLEAEFFGGMGSQRAALWVDGALALGPLAIEEGQPFQRDGSPISRLLRHLGVTRRSDSTSSTPWEWAPTDTPKTG
jgi:hypothetical protein